MSKIQTDPLPTYANVIGDIDAYEAAKAQDNKEQATK